VSTLAALAIVVSCAVAAGVAAVVVDHIIALEQRRRHHDVGNPVFQLIGILFSVILAFVFSEVWGQYDTAAQAISSECGALHGAAILADTLPDSAGHPVNVAIGAYVQKVISTEWQAMAEQRRSTVASREFQAAIDEAARLRVVNAPVQTQILALLAEAHAQRETRTFQLTLGVPLTMWAILIFLASILVAFVVLSGTEEPGTIIFASSFTACIVSVLVLVRMLDFPFEGALALGDGNFVKLAGEIAALLAPH
jgi:hypothetical protein